VDDVLRNAVPTRDVPDEDKSVVHNVTSSLCSHSQVRAAISTAIEGVCQQLDLPAAVKGKRGKKDHTQVPHESDEELETAKRADTALSQSEEEEEWQGLDDRSEDESENDVTDSDGSEDDDALEAALSKYDSMLGNSSDEEDPDDIAESILLQSKKPGLYDELSLSGSPSPIPDDDDDDDDDDDEPPKAPLPPPAKKEMPQKERKLKPVKSINTGESMFLPSLMGGYFSGSESASDVDVAPAKKRLGQRQRQAKWEKKFGGKAKHLEKQAKEGSNAAGKKGKDAQKPHSETNVNGGRDDGWDLRRGAVDGDPASRRRPWEKKRDTSRAQEKSMGEQHENKKPKTAKDGPIHPSWEAAKKAKAKASIMAASFKGQKVVFD
jgi:hypothetical protein